VADSPLTFRFGNLFPLQKDEVSLSQRWHFPLTLARPVVPHEIRWARPKTVRRVAAISLLAGVKHPNAAPWPCRPTGLPD
jgi:hypothetical protein